MTRTIAVATVVLPLAVTLAAHDARLRAQAAEGRSGIELSAMDRDADPCQDFYQYACGGWIAKHPTPPDRPRYSRFNELQDRNDEILRDILENASRPGAAAETKKIGDFYASCIDEKAIDGKGLAPLEPELKRVDAIASKAQIPAVLGHLDTVGETAFFGFSAQPDLKNSTEYLVVFSQGGLGLPDRDYYLSDNPKSVAVRTAYERHVARMLTLAGAPGADATASAAAVLRIETALARAALDRVARRNANNVYHKMTRDQVRTLMPSFNMSGFFETAEAPRGEFANVAEPAFLKAVDGVIASTPLPELKAYMRWHVLHANAAMLPGPFEQENFAFFNKTLTGVSQQLPRWKRCVRAVDASMGEALGKLYVERTFGAENKQRTERMVQAIEAAMGQDLREIGWMSPETKTQAEAKLRDVANKIGYPDKWRDYASLDVVRGDALGNAMRARTFAYRWQMAKIGKPVDRTEWRMTPPTVNAYYNPSENNINFPAGILQPPFYRKDADDAVNFGAACAVVGHELTHGFDDSGRRFDGKGNLRDWWTPADASAFEERASCIADEYSGFTAVDDVKLNGRLTLGENSADNGGLRLAWMALMEEMKTKALDTVDGFTPEQRFFLGWAQMWCENSTPENSRLLALTDPHSPGRYRTNGVVSNMPEFQKAFSCSADAPMVRQKICRVW